MAEEVGKRSDNENEIKKEVKRVREIEMEDGQKKSNIHITWVA